MQFGLVIARQDTPSHRTMHCNNCIYIHLNIHILYPVFFAVIMCPLFGACQAISHIVDELYMIFEGGKT